MKYLGYGYERPCEMAFKAKCARTSVNTAVSLVKVDSLFLLIVDSVLLLSPNYKGQCNPEIKLAVNESASSGE